MRRAMGIRRMTDKILPPAEPPYAERGSIQSVWCYLFTLTQHKRRTELPMREIVCYQQTEHKKAIRRWFENWLGWQDSNLRLLQPERREFEM